MKKQSSGGKKNTKGKSGGSASKSTALEKTVPFKKASETFSFDALYDMDSKEVEKEVKRDTKRKGKMVQTLSKVSQGQLLLDDAQTAYAKSLTDPTQDSTAAKLKVMALERELKVSTEIYEQLFSPIGKAAK